MHPFPSINQFRNVVAHVRRKASFMGLDEAGEPIINHAAKFPTLNFIGTVKLHGTNAAVVFTPEGISFQSRERVLSQDADNMGFYAHMVNHQNNLEDLECHILRAAGLPVTIDNTVAVYGEWCGGNIQRSVAITSLPKMFVVFAIKINGEWFDKAIPSFTDIGAGIYSIHDFPSFVTAVDFEHPETSQNKLAELTLMVENECPVGKYFGVSGIGEGIVWRCVENPSSDYWFKVKGEKHSVSKVKTLASVDVEAVQNLTDFVTKTVTEARLEQGYQKLAEQGKPFNMTSMGDFIRWVHNDVLKEETDTLAASGIDSKKLGGPLAQAAKRWYINKLNKSLSLV